MSDLKVVLVYSNSVTSYSLFRDALRQFPSAFACVIEAPSIPKKSGSRLPKGSMLEKIKRSSLSFLLLNFVFIHVYATLSSIARKNLKNECRRLHIEHRKLKYMDETEIANLKEIDPDYIFNNSSLILKKEEIASAKLGVLNYHGAPLPDYRGAANYFWMLQEGETLVHGTQHFVDTGLDTGPVIARSEPVRIEGPTSCDVLRLTIIRKGRSLVLDALGKMRAGQPLEAVPQPKIGTTRSFPTKADAQTLYKRGHSVVSVSGILQVVKLAIVGKD